MVRFWRKDRPRFNKEENNPPSTVSKEHEENQPNPLLINTIARDTQQSLRGAKLRFTEDVQNNLALVKQLFPSDTLTVETITLGNLAAKQVFILYIQNIANPGIVKEVKHRLTKIKTKILTDSSYIQRNIEDSSLSPFPQIETTERPDTVVNGLLQGRIAILLNGCPNILIAPCTFYDLIDTPDDVYSRWFVTASFFRIARFIMLFLAICLPGFYIALLSFNPELLPTKIFTLILNSRKTTPFPVYFETFLLMGVAEAIRMMMIRMPSQLGSTLALFSGLTLIIAGMYSGVIGSILVILVTLSIICSFAIPDYDLRSSVRMVQFFTMIISSFFGLFGFALSIFLISFHLVSLKSFGIPYMAPMAPIEGSSWGHTLLRENTKTMSPDKTYKPQISRRKNR